MSKPVCETHECAKEIASTYKEDFIELLIREASEFFMSTFELSGKSVLPIEPLNNVSPVKTRAFPSLFLPTIWYLLSLLYQIH